MSSKLFVLCKDTQRLLSQMMRPPKYRFFFEDIKDEPKKTAARVRGKLAHDQRMQVWTDILRGAQNRLTYWVRTGRDFLRSTKKRFIKWWKRPKKWEFTIKIRWVLAAFLLLHFYTPHKVIAEDPLPNHKLAILKPIKANNYPEQSEAQPIVVTSTVAPVQAPQAQAVTDCGSDPYMAYIYQHESGCRTNAINPIGACGLGQALPCGKMGCSLSDWACQDAWFRAYAVSVYGSTYNAYLAWTSKHWW